MNGTAGIVAFDLDGTLVPNTTVCLHLGPWVGHHEIEELERLYELGEMTNTEVAERDATFYKNRCRQDVWRHLEQLELIDGLEDTITWLKTHSLVPIIATVTMSTAADFLCDRYGFAAGSGCELAETDDGLLLGTSLATSRPKTKRRLLERSLKITVWASRMWSRSVIRHPISPCSRQPDSRSRSTLLGMPARLLISSSTRMTYEMSFLPSTAISPAVPKVNAMTQRMKPVPG